MTLEGDFPGAERDAAVFAGHRGNGLSIRSVRRLVLASTAGGAEVDRFPPVRSVGRGAVPLDRHAADWVANEGHGVLKSPARENAWVG